MTQITPSERDAIYRWDFFAFTQAAYHVLEPNGTFEPNWHHESIAKALMEATGTKTRKYVSGPPRSFKSIIASVAWGCLQVGA
jgi:hypothetical protein